MHQKRKRLIVKYGSKCVVNGDSLDIGKVDFYAAKLANLTKTYDLDIVSSGSVAYGKRIVKSSQKDHKEFDDRVLASMGSAGLAEVWRLAFARHGLLSGQLLVTHRELEDQKESSDLRQAIYQNSKAGVISVCNENDLLSDKELKKLSYGGDNDGLAAHLAVRLRADKLLLLTDVDGLLVGGKLKLKIQASEINDLKQNLNQSNDEGTGSMASKLEAAAFAAQNGVQAFIGKAEADYDEILKGIRSTEVLK